jgi:hypothetical protein
MVVVIVKDGVAVNVGVFVIEHVGLAVVVKVKVCVGESVAV